MINKNAIEYRPELDGIRAFSALAIVAFHSYIPGLSGGFFAVDVFFVLSGYLVTQILNANIESSGKVRWTNFVKRRLLRLMPALLVMLVAYVLTVPFFWSAETPWKDHAFDALLTSFYVANWIQPLGGDIAVLGHVWSLAIEMQFYLLWPLVVYMVLKLRRMQRIGALVMLYLATSIWRFIGSTELDAAWDMYTRTDMHATGLILGAILALLPPKRLAYLTVPGLLVLAFCFTFFSTHWEPTVRYGFTLAELGAALLILGRPTWLGHPVLGWLGQVSYGVYLWHFPIMLYMRMEELPWQQVFLFGLSLALLFASLSYYLVELRFHKPIRKRRLEAGAG